MTDPNAPVEKIWLRDYPPDVPAEIDPDSIPSLKHLYEHAFRKHAASTAYSNMGRSSRTRTSTSSRAASAPGCRRSRGSGKATASPS